MKRRPIFTLPLSDLEQMPTEQLLARLNRLHQCEDSLALSDRDTRVQATPGTIEFKQTPEWATAYAQLKELLEQREHIPRNGKRRVKQPVFRQPKP